MIGLHDPSLEAEDREAVAAALSTGWLSGGGRQNDVLEKLLQDKLSLRISPLSVVNGTGALQLAALLSGFERGDHALVSDNGFIGAANAVRLAGGEPILLGASGEDDPSVSLEQIQEFFSSHVDDAGRFVGTGRKVRAFFYNSPYGLAGDLRGIAGFLREREILLVEDAAQAFGVRQGGRFVGTFGNFGCLSFNGNKTVAAGSGGALFVSDEALADRARRLRHHGRCDSFDFFYESLGGNYMMPNTLAALVASQMARLDRILDRKSAVRRYYENAYRENTEIGLLGPRDGAPYWVNIVLFPRALDRCDFQKIAAEMERAGFQVRPCFPPLSLCAPYRSSPLFFPQHTAALFGRGLVLPSGLGVTEEDVFTVRNLLREIWSSLSRRHR